MARDPKEDPYYNPDFSDEVNEVTNSFVYEKKVGRQATGDAIIVRPVGDGTWEVLLIERSRGPHQGGLALPGGFKEGADSVEDFVAREALEETGLTNNDIKRTIDLPTKTDRYDWDVRFADGVDVSGKIYVVDESFIPIAGDDAVSARFVNIDEIAKGNVDVAFLHTEWIADTAGELEMGGILQGALDEQAEIDGIRNSDFMKEINEKRKIDNQPLMDINKANESPSTSVDRLAEQRGPWPGDDSPSNQEVFRNDELMGRVDNNAIADEVEASQFNDLGDTDIPDEIEEADRLRREAELEITGDVEDVDMGTYDNVEIQNELAALSDDDRLRLRKALEQFESELLETTMEDLDAFFDAKFGRDSRILNGMVFQNIDGQEIPIGKLTDLYREDAWNRFSNDVMDEILLKKAGIQPVNTNIFPEGEIPDSQRTFVDDGTEYYVGDNPPRGAVDVNTGKKVGRNILKNIGWLDPVEEGITTLLANLGFKGTALALGVADAVNYLGNAMASASSAEAKAQLMQSQALMGEPIDIEKYQQDVLNNFGQSMQRADKYGIFSNASRQIGRILNRQNTTPEWNQYGTS
tara:strand:- start:2215 stop:3954 length:1740 start_codon:yes stop_codon:yes gene_type:complete